MALFSRLLIVCCMAALAAVPARAQIKIGRIDGGTGSFTAATGLAFQATGNVGYVSHPGSGLVQKFRVTSGEILGEVQLAAAIGPITLAVKEKTLAVLGVTAQKIYLVDTEKMTVSKELSRADTGFTNRCNMIITQDETRLFIADPKNDAILVFDLKLGAFERSLAVGINPTILTLKPNGKEFGVLCSGRRSDDEESVQLIDTITLGVVQNRVLDAGKTEPYNNVEFSNINNISRYLLVGVSSTSTTTDRLSILDLNTGQLSSRESGGKGPARLLASPNGRHLVVVNVTTKNVVLMSLPEAMILKDFPLPDSDFTVDTQLTFSQDGRILYVPSLNTGEVILIDVEDKSIKTRVTVGTQPVVVALSRDGTMLVSVNTGSNEVALVALSPLSLYVPHMIQNATEFGGLALANFGSEGATVALVARDDAGTTITGTSNPKLLTVPKGEQVSMVFQQIFGFSPTATLSGSIEAYTLGAGIAGLSLSGTITQSQLDGFLVSGTVGKLLGFSRITEGVSMFGSTTSTDIVIDNPSDSSAAITSRLYGTTLEGEGRLLSHATRTLQPHARLRVRLTSLHPDVAYPLAKAYLELTSDVSIQALEIVQIGDSIATIPAKRRDAPETSLFAAQFVTGGLGPVYFSHVTLANVTDKPITITAEVTDDAGKIIPAGSKPITRTIPGYEVLQGFADTLFEFPNPLSDPKRFEGSLKITTDVPGIIGDVIFGDARDGRFLSSQSFGLTSATKLAFVHFAEGSFGGKTLYTGIAFYNPGRDVVDVTIEVFSPKNELLGKGEIRLEGGKRTAQTVQQLVPAITQQNGGTIRITSTGAIYAFEVFGSNDLEFLAAVPAVVLP